jgi:hypothetical protein
MHASLVRKPEGKGPLGRPKSRWENNIEVYVKEKSAGLRAGRSGF